MTTYTLTGNEQTYSSSTKPIYDTEFRMWRCTTDDAADYNVVDMTGDTYTVTASPPTIPAMQFMMCFYPQEQAYIQNSTDSIVNVFWTRFSDPRVTEINLNSESMTQTLDYLSATNVLPALTPPAPYLASGRSTQILTGVPV